MIYNNPFRTAPKPRSLLDRRVEIDNRTLEIAAYVLLFIGSIVLHLWQLDVKAMHHDESIHAWISHRFATGTGDFTCAAGRKATTYCYDPVYHGPTLYVLTLLSYFLFGTGDAQARLPMALAGIGLVPMAWMLREFIGRKGAFIAAVLMTISPSILYYTRFARHDALVLLWSLFMLVGIFRFIQHGRAANLSLALAGIALTWATHELVFILLFIGGSFFGFRLLWEWRSRAFSLVLVVIAGLMLAYVGLRLMPLPPNIAALDEWLQRGLGPVLLLGAGSLLVLPMERRWEPRPVVRERLAHTWQQNRRALLIAGATFLAIFGLLFTTFGADPRGFVDGWYQGIAYWLGSQHEFARGDQPWFYYLMLVPIYDLLALVFGLVGMVWLMASRVPQRAKQRSKNIQQNIASGEPQATNQEVPAGNLARVTTQLSLSDGHNGNEPTTEVAASDATSLVPRPPLLVFFLGYWFIQSLIAFSWAGEKMPWLVTHITLPAILLAAWVLAQLIERVPWRDLRRGGWTIPLLTLTLLLLLGAAAYNALGTNATAATAATPTTLLQILAPLLGVGFCIFGLLQLANRLGGRVIWRVMALTGALVLGLYGVRAATLVVYRHPDTPIEPLIYTQTAPDVPLLVQQIERIAVNETRNDRTPEDPTGGNSLKLVISGGASERNNEGSLAWPLQWYLRDFGNNNWFDPDTEQIDEDARIVVLYKPQLDDNLRGQLEADFVQTHDSMFNWWFPEHRSYDVNNPGQQAQGYKTLATEGNSSLERVWNVVSWPFTPANWPALGRYMVYRELPLELRGREMVVFMHNDLVPGGAAATNSTETTTLQPAGTLGQGQLTNARGVARDAQDNLYVADAGNHRVVVLNPAGELVRTIGSFGNGPGQLNEPSGVSLDAEDNVYVADTWNARIAKFGPDGAFITSWGDGTTPYGESSIDPATGQSVQQVVTSTGGEAAANAANPLGFFGPRNVLVAGDRVYIADTGNARVVVTDLDGNVMQQWGSEGEAEGQFREPIGLGVDEQGRVLVGDTWNGRVQVFASENGTIAATPTTTISVPGWQRNTYTDPYIAVASDGRMWAAQGGRRTIAEYDAAGQLVRRLRSDPALAGPRGMTVDSDNVLYVVDGGTQVVKLDPQ